MRKHPNTGQIIQQLGNTGVMCLAGPIFPDFLIGKMNLVLEINLSFFGINIHFLRGREKCKLKYEAIYMDRTTLSKE